MHLLIVFDHLISSLGYVLYFAQIFFFQTFRLLLGFLAINGSEQGTAFSRGYFPRVPVIQWLEQLWGTRDQIFRSTTVWGSKQVCSVCFKIMNIKEQIGAPRWGFQQVHEVFCVLLLMQSGGPKTEGKNFVELQAKVQKTWCSTMIALIFRSLTGTTRKFLFCDPDFG